MRKRRLLAWLVHLYTATGALLGMFALIAAAQGETRNAFLLLLLAGLVDSTDGLLARRARVAEVLPNFSGEQLDNAIDVLTFIWVPIFILVAEDLLPHPIWIAIPTLAALYAYGQVDMKTPDHFFLGFPSYWNVVALYLYWLRPSGALAVGMVAVPGLLSFIPTRYLYPSRNGLYSKSIWTLGCLWAALIAFLLLQESPDRRLVWLSALFPLYYLALSFCLDLQLRRKARRST